MADQEPPSSAPRDGGETASFIPGLPDDIAVQCIARVSLLHHPTLSLVSKSWRSLLRSPHLFSTRSLLRCSEHPLFLCLRQHRSLHWFSLLHRSLPLRPLPPTPCLPAGSATVAFRRSIYILGGSVNDTPSQNVWIYDAVHNRWESGRRMRVGREFPAAGAVSGKIYAIGGCLVDNWARSVNWAEVFDPELGFWSAVPSPIPVREKWMHASAVAEGKIYAMADRGGVVFDPKAAAWEVVSAELDSGWRGRAVVVEGVLYCYDYMGKIKGFDVEEGKWKELRGVENGLPRFLCGATMANAGGRLVVFWEEKTNYRIKKDIMCAEIDVVKNGNGELWGSIVWSNFIFSVPMISMIIHCLAVEL